jgi:hypothetical protein
LRHTMRTNTSSRCRRYGAAMKHCVALERSFGFCTRVAIVRSLTVAARIGLAPRRRGTDVGTAPACLPRMLVRGDLRHTLLGTRRQRSFPSHRTGPRGAEKDQAHEPRYEKPPAHQSPDPRDQPLLAPARAQPHRLVRMGRGGLRPCGQRRQAHLPEHRVCRLSLVPRDGARDFRERSGRPGRQRPLHLRQGRSRGTARRGRDLHAGHHHDESGSRGLADVGLVDARSPSDLRGTYLPQENFLHVCDRIHELWRDNRSQLLEQGDRIQAHLDRWAAREIHPTNRSFNRR